MRVSPKGQEGEETVVRCNVRENKEKEGSCYF